MDFKDLTYIVAISKHQSITKASNELYVTQPTLSKFLQNIESKLGQKLFKKVGNRFLLTYAGEKYVERAVEILQLKKTLDDEMSDIIKADRGKLNIGCPHTRATYTIHKTLPEFKTAYENVKLNVFEDTSAGLESKLLSGEIDLAFFNSPIINDNIDFEVLAQEEVLLVASKQNPIAQRAEHREGCRYPWLDLKKLDDQLFILQKEGQRTQGVILNQFKKSSFSPKRQMAIRNIHAAIELAARNYGIAFSSETHLKHFKIDNEYNLFSFGDPSVFFNFVVAYRKDTYLSRHALEYIKILKKSIVTPVNETD